MNLLPAIPPSFLKIGFFGETGTGKTFTSAKVLSEFVAKYCPGSQIAMYDTEPSAGFIAPMVKKITGKDLVVCSSRSFSDLLEFTDECVKHKLIGIADSITHPWRSLCSDYLEAKKSRVKSAGGRVETTKLSLKDWGPIKEIWNTFSEKYVFSPIHFCINGRQGDAWDTVIDDEGNESMQKTGVKMKTEAEFGHEPSLLIQMRFEHEKHIAFVQKDRFDLLTGKFSNNNPSLSFFEPHISALNIGGKHVVKSEGKKIFEQGQGPNWETIKAQREAILENIKDDITLVYPGRSAEESKIKIEIMREAFGTSAWSELENDDKKYSNEDLKIGREKLQTILKGKSNVKDTK